METLLSKLEAFRSGMTPESGTDIYLSASELETIISLLKDSNQPTGEGVKSAEEYLDDVLRLTYSARNGFIPQKDVLKALTAQARDYEANEGVILLDYTNWLSQQNFTNPDINPEEWVQGFRNDRSKPNNI